MLKERQGWMMARMARLLEAQVAIMSADVGGQAATIPSISCGLLEPMSTWAYRLSP